MGALRLRRGQHRARGQRDPRCGGDQERPRGLLVPGSVPPRAPPRVVLAAVGREPGRREPAGLGRRGRRPAGGEGARWRGSEEPTIPPPTQGLENGLDCLPPPPALERGRKDDRRPVWRLRSAPPSAPLAPPVGVDANSIALPTDPEKGRALGMPATFPKLAQPAASSPSPHREETTGAP